MKTELQGDGTIMPRSSAAGGCAGATFDFQVGDDNMTSEKDAETILYGIFFIVVAIILFTYYVSGAGEHVQNGGRIFNDKCVRCHFGSNDVPNVLSSDSESKIKNIIRNGSYGMPAFNSSEINDNDLDDLTRYIIASYWKDYPGS